MAVLEIPKARRKKNYCPWKFAVVKDDVSFFVMFVGRLSFLGLILVITVVMLCVGENTGIFFGFKV